MMRFLRFAFRCDNVATSFEAWRDTVPMKMWIRTMAVVVATMAIGGCATIAANHDFNPAVNFDQYKTFSWVSPHPLVDPSPGDNAQLEGRVEQIARDLLTAKGYRFVDDAERADFVVGFGLGATEKLRIDTYPAAYRGPWHWHGSQHIRASSDATVRQHADGRLIVDIFDVRSHQPAWHGWATRTITTDDLKDPQPAIRAALTAILANFPPG
jgi:hypothetical protein